MKKIGKKLSYITKVFLAVGLLFNNLSSLSIVFAAEIDPNDGQTEVSPTPEGGNGGTITTDPNDGTTGDTTLGDGDDGDKTPVTPENGDNNGETPTTPSDGDDGNNGTGDTDKPTVDPDAGDDEPAQEPVELKYEISINENDVVIKYNKAAELGEEATLLVVEDFEYLDGTTYGGAQTTYELTDEVRAALASEEGYSVTSAILPDNIYAGEYSVNVYVNEEQRLTSKVIEAEGEGIEFKLYTADEQAVSAADDGVYYFESDESSFIVTARLLNGGVSPSDMVTVGEEEVNASELFTEGQILEEALEGYLHGEFEYKVSLDYSLGGNAKTAEATFDIFYLYYSDNTDALNESAKNVGLDSKYIFVGGYADNVVYALDNDDIEEVLKDFVGEDGIITYEISTENGLEITLTDGRVTITYEEASLDDEHTIDTLLETASTEVSTGETFTVDFIVKLTDNPINGLKGLVNYDDKLLNLIKIESATFEGNFEDNKFLYAQWEMLQAEFEEDDEGNIEYIPTDYTVLTITFEALEAGEANISVEDAQFYQRSFYLLPTDENGVTVTIISSSDNSLASLKVAGQEIPLTDDESTYTIDVENDVTSADIEAIASNSSAKTSLFYPEELAEGENTIRIVVTAANGEKREYKVIVNRKAAESEEEEPAVQQTSYTDDTYADGSSDDDNKVAPTDGDGKNATDDDDNDDAKENNLSRIIIIILILLVIAGLIYLIFKDDGDEEEKQANRDIDKLKKDDGFEPQPKKTEHKPNNKNKNRSRNTQNNKKGR